MYLTPDSLVQNRYKVIRPVGSGGMGAVYEAFDQRLKKSVALKQLKHALLTTPEARQAFEREAQLLASLRHPALPVVSDHFEEGDDLFLVMDFIPGSDLSALLQRRGQPFPEHEVLAWAEQILSALDYLHRQNPPVIHRDIKPGNLKLTPDQRIYLLDFGISKGIPDNQGQLMSSFGSTPAYAPFEQVAGRGTTARSDLYALAATLYQLLTCKLPESALARQADLGQYQPDPLVPPHALDPRISRPVSDVLMIALELDANKRYSSAAAMRKALQDAKDTVQLTPQPTRELTTEMLPAAPDTIVQTPPPVSKPVISENTARSISNAPVPPPAVGQTGPARSLPALPRLLVLLVVFISIVGVVWAGMLFVGRPPFPQNAVTPTAVVTVSSAPGRAATSTTMAMATAKPISTLAPTSTLVPSATATARPSATATARPSATATAEPTATPEPTVAPTSVPTPRPPPRPTAPPRPAPTEGTSPNP